MNPNDTGSSVDIITYECLKKLIHPGRDIVPFIHPILGFRGQEINPTGMICFPVHFGDKLKVRHLEVEFLVVNVPTAYSVIDGRSTLHLVKVVVAPYLLQLQYEADDGSVGDIRGDQRTTWNATW